MVYCLCLLWKLLIDVVRSFDWFVATFVRIVLVLKVNGDRGCSSNKGRCCCIRGAFVSVAYVLTIYFSFFVCQMCVMDVTLMMLMNMAFIIHCCGALLMYVCCSDGC